MTNLPSVPVDPARVAHERGLARAMLTAQSEDAHEAAVTAIARYFNVCDSCVADALMLYQRTTG